MQQSNEQLPTPRRSGASRVASIVARLAVALVFVINVQCALSFVLDPATYTPQFGLGNIGIAGETAVAGLGIAFLMWNATYPAVIVSPRRFRALFVVVLVQQFIGLVGESWLRFGLPAGHTALTTSIDRFIAFDALGLVLMGATFIWLVVADRKQ